MLCSAQLSSAQLCSVLSFVLSSVLRLDSIAVRISCESLLFVRFSMCSKALRVRAVVPGSCDMYRHAARLNMTSQEVICLNAGLFKSDRCRTACNGWHHIFGVSQPARLH